MNSSQRTFIWDTPTSKFVGNKQLLCQLHELFSYFLSGVILCDVLFTTRAKQFQRSGGLPIA